MLRSVAVKALLRACGGGGWGGCNGARGVVCWSTLPNCIRVVTETTATPLAAVALYVEAGSRFETDCNNGATHFFEHLAFKGFGKMTRVSLETSLLACGIRLYVHTDREYQAFTATCLVDNVEPSIKYLSTMIICPHLTVADICASKEAVYQELEDADVDARRVTFDHLHSTAFQGTTLERAPIGPWSNYVSFDGPFMRSFVQQQFQPFRLIISVSSAYSHEEVLCMVQRALCCMQATTNKLVNWPCRFSGSMFRFRNDDAPYLHLAVAFECGGYFSPTYHTLQVMKHYMGSYHESQKQGERTWPYLPHACELADLCVSCETFYLPYRDVGLFGVYSVMRADCEVDDLLFNVQGVFRTMCTNICPADIARATDTYLMEIGNNYRGALNSVRDMALQIMFWGQRYTFEQQVGKARNIDSSQVMALSDVVLFDRCPAVSAYGPTESVPEYNRLRQGQYWLRL